MTNTQAWDRLASRRGEATGPTPCSSGPTSRPRPTSGSAATSRAAGCSTSDAAPARTRWRWPRQGAHVIAIDVVARRSSRSDAGWPKRPRSRVEWHQGDAADLAFLRADSIDLALAAGVVHEVEDLDRLFRQVHRVLRAGAPRSCSRTTTRCASRSAATTTSPVVSRSVGSRSGARTSTRRRSSRRATTSSSRCGRARSPTCSRGSTAPATASTCSSSPRCCGPPIPARPFPTAVLWRARKEGV